MNTSINRTQSHLGSSIQIKFTVLSVWFIYSPLPLYCNAVVSLTDIPVEKCIHDQEIV